MKFPLSKILSDLCCLWAISFFSKKYFLCKILNDLRRSESLLRGHSNFQIPCLNNLRLVQKKPGGGECLMWKNILGITDVLNIISASHNILLNLSGGDFLCMATKIFHERPEILLLFIIISVLMILSSFYSLVYWPPAFSTLAAHQRKKWAGDTQSASSRLLINHIGSISSYSICISVFIFLYLYFCFCISVSVFLCLYICIWISASWVDAPQISPQIMKVGINVRLLPLLLCKLFQLTSNIFQ